jgi:membrane protein DedA with SNARE-associated domain
MTPTDGSGEEVAVSSPFAAEFSHEEWAERRHVVTRCLWILGILGAGSLVGVAASLYLTAHHPLLLIALSPLGRHLILVAPRVDPVSFLLVAITRRLIFYLACFHLGRALGPTALVWLEQRSSSAGRVVRWLEQLFQRASRLVVVLFPSPAVSTIAGSAGMRQMVFVPLALLGSVARLLILLQFADWLRAPIEVVLAFIDEYWIPGTVILVVGILVYQARLQRSQRA